MKNLLQYSASINCQPLGDPGFAFLFLARDDDDDVVQSVTSSSLQPQGLQHARLLCLSLSSRVCSNSCLLSRWWHPTISSSAAAAAKSLELCPALCDPIDGSPAGFPVPGILQARTLEWVAISFSNTWKWKKVKLLSRVWLLASPWISSSIPPLSSCLQSLPASESSSESAFCIRWYRYWSFSISLSMRIQGWFPLGWTGLISLLSKGPSRVFPSTTVLKASILQCSAFFMVIPGGSDGKESACDVGDPGLIPGSGRSPGEENGNPLQLSC